MTEYKVERTGRRHTVTWEGVTTAGNASIPSVAAGAGLALASVQVTGTFGSATVAFHGSNDGTNFVALNDVEDTTIGITSAGASEFSSGMAYFKPVVSGGTGDDLDVTLVYWSD